MIDTPRVRMGVSRGSRRLAALVIGASTGGPIAVERVLSTLPSTFPVPVAVCQHMPEGFTSIWAQHLDDVCALRVKEARSGESFRPGVVYVAPVGRHMRLRGTSASAFVSLQTDQDGMLHVPSIDLLFESAAATFGSSLLAVLLTGLGTDGAQGLLSVRRAGGYTVTESSDSALAESMPESARALGASTESVHIEAMAEVIIGHVAGHRPRSGSRLHEDTFSD